MKFILTTLFAAAGLFSSTAAFANQDALASIGLSPACEHVIFQQVEGQCNRDTQANPDREHQCLFWGQVSIKRNTPTHAYFEADFTIADAEVFTYGVSLQDKSTCRFVVVSRN